MIKHKINSSLFVLNIVLLSLMYWDNSNLPWILLAAFMFFFLILSYGVLFMTFNYFIQSKNAFPKPHVLLTFDDGPNPHTTPIVLDILKESKVTAIFFVIGSKAKFENELIKRIIDEGHFIGNHTFSHHPIFALLNRTKVEKEIVELNHLFINQGIQTNLFRPPIGYTNPIIARVVIKLSLNIIGWNKRSFDTVIRNPKKLTKRLLFLAKPGSIILLHDNLKQTSEALSLFLKESQEKGIIFANKNQINSFLND